MAVSTFATSQLNRLFERQYSTFIDMLNYGFEILDHVSKKKAEFDGEFFYYPVTVTRAGHGRYQGEAQAQPTPHGVEDDTIRFQPTEFIDKIAFSWRMLMQASSPRLHSKIARRIARVVKENREFCDKIAIFGNATRGFGSTRTLSTAVVTNTAAPIAGLFRLAAANVLNYDGDHTRFATAVAANPLTWIPITVRFLDDYADAAADGEGLPGLALGTAQFYVVASDAVAGTISVQVVATVNTSALFINNTAILDGFSYGIELSATSTVGGVVVGAPQFGLTTPGDASQEMTGIFSNLGAGTYGGKDRSTAGFSSLRSTCITMGNTLLHPRTNFTATRLQVWLDEMQVLGGGQPTDFWMSPLMRSRYVAAVTVVLANSTSRHQVTDGAGGKGDIGVKTIEYAGYKMRTALNMPKGLLVALNDETWMVLTVGGKLIDFRRQGGGEDGPLFYDDPGTTTGNAVLYGVHQLICNRPNYGNGILNGITLS